MSRPTTDSKLLSAANWLAAFILALLPFQAFLTTWAGSNFGHLDLWVVWKELLIILLIPAALILIKRDDQLRHWLAGSWLVRLIAIYFGLHMVMAWWALAADKVNGEALAHSLVINLRFFGFFLICLILAASSGWLNKHWSKILLLPSVIVVGFGLIQKLFLPADWLRHFGYSPETVPAYQTVDANLDYRRVQSTLRGANPLGAYLVLIVTALAARFNIRDWRRLVFLAASLTAVFFSYSRSAWLGLAISLGLLAWWAIGRRPGGRMMVIGSTLLALALGVLLVVNSQYFEKAFLHTDETSTSRRSSNEVRLKALEKGVRDVINQPLGRGPGTAGPASFRNDQPPRIAENYYLQVGQEVGVIGIGLFAAINLIAARQLWIYRRDLLARLLLASLAGITFINLVSHAWTDDTLSLIWWGLAGIAIGSFLSQNKPKAN